MHDGPKVLDGLAGFGEAVLVAGGGLERVEVEIGRAAWRGRGEISVVAGSLKKKKNTL